MSEVNLVQLLDDIRSTKNNSKPVTASEAKHPSIRPWDGTLEKQLVPPPEEQPKKTVRRIKDVVQDWRNEGKLERIATGIATLDGLSKGGILIGRRVVFVGAPSAGKTFLEVVVANEFIRRNFEFGWMAVDEDDSDITCRFAQMYGLSREELEGRTDETLARVAEKLPFLAFYDSTWTIEEAVEDLAARCAVSGKRGLLCIDSAHTVRCEASLKATSYKDVVEANLKALKLANERHGFTILCTAEMNRSGYANEKTAQEANRMALAAESRAFEFWAQLQITLQTPKDFGHIVHCVISKNRGALKGEFWLDMDHEAHVLCECQKPGVSSEERAEKKLEEKIAEATRLAKFILNHQDLTLRDLRTAVSLEKSLGWGHGKLDDVLEIIRAGKTDYTISEKGKPHHAAVK